MGSGKSGGKSKDYFGHMAWIVCQGQLDFTWGLMIDNELAWPDAKTWDAQIYKKNKAVIYTDGKVYRTPDKTKVDPNASPWVLLALPWVAGTYHSGDYVLSSGFVWKAVSTTSSAPPVAIPSSNGRLSSTQVTTNGWQYFLTPETWVSGGGSNFWPTNSIVAWKGRLWTNSAGTKVEPPGAPWSLWKINRVDVPNPLKFTVTGDSSAAGAGDWYLYWGTATQNLDTVNEAVLDSLDHPPYRNRAVLVGKDILFGTMRQTPPDPVLLGGRSPVQTLITGTAANMDADWQVNPWCVLAEFLTHPVIGLGLPNSAFDQTTWQAEADRCAANPELYYISPMITSLKKVREIVSEILSYPDSFVFWSTVATLIAGHWPHAEAAPTFTSANTIDRNDITEEIKWGSDGWGGTANAVKVSFQDVEAAFKDRPVMAPNLFNRAVVGRLQTVSVDRPHITRVGQAIAWASELAKVEGDQKFEGSLSVLAEKAGDILPGTIFRLTDDVLGLSQAQRCVRRTVKAPPDGIVEISHQTERGLTPLSYTPTPVNPAAPVGPPPAAVLNAQAFLMPDTLSGGTNKIGIVAQRENNVTTGFDLWFRSADGSAYQNLGSQSGFGVYCPNLGNFANTRIETGGPFNNGDTWQLTYFPVYAVFILQRTKIGFVSVTMVEGVDYFLDYDTGIITINWGAAYNGWSLAINYFNSIMVTPSGGTAEDIQSLSAPLTDDELADNALLLIGFRHDNPNLFEIMTVKSLTAVIGGHYELEIVGQRFGTERGGDGTYLWSIDNASTFPDIGFLIRRSALRAFSHTLFDQLSVDEANADFIIAPASAWVKADITDIYDSGFNPDGLATKLSYSFKDFYAPTALFVQLFAGGTAITDFASTTYLTTAAFSFTIEFSDANGDLLNAQLVASRADSEILLWSKTLDGYQKSINVNFTIPVEGDWDLFVRVSDSSGRVRAFPLTLVGSTAAEVLQVRAPATTKVANPVFALTKRPSYYHVTLSCSTSGSSIEYQVVTKYDPIGVTWTTYSSPFSVPYGKTVYARGKKAGSTTSDVVSRSLLR